MNEQDQKNLIDLPLETHVEFISYLGEADRKNLALTCKIFNNIANLPILWKQSCKRAGIHFNDHSDYKDIYKKTTTIDIKKIYYVMGSPIKIYEVKEIYLYGFRSTYTEARDILKNEVIDSFPKQDEIEVFTSKENAIKHALLLGDKISKVNGYMTSFPTVFSIKFEKCQRFFSPTGVNDFNTKNKNINILAVKYAGSQKKEINISSMYENPMPAPNPILCVIQ